METIKYETQPQLILLDGEVVELPPQSEMEEVAREYNKKYHQELPIETHQISSAEQRDLAIESQYYSERG